MNRITEIGYYDGALFVSLWSAIRDINTNVCQPLFEAGHDLYVHVCDAASEIREMPVSRSQALSLIDVLN
ncbi:MAG: hypothetical protein IKO41_06405 [Lachnospiraceae bacterium]|nr:hypothetical protein [Lachnospiraceae bacterium]